MIKKLLSIGIVILTACSPYKKIVITMSNIQTENWIDKPESNVISKLGPYKTKTLNEMGYFYCLTTALTIIPHKRHSHLQNMSQP